MNTKILRLSIAICLLAFPNFSLAANQHKSPAIVSNNLNAIAAAENKQPADYPFSNMLVWSNEHPITDQSTQDHDHKSHHFHYQRFYNSRKRLLVILMLKFLLLLTHASIFLGVMLHAIH